MSREFWPPWFPVDEWFPEAAPYIELALDFFWFWMLVPALLFIAWTSWLAVESFADNRLTVMPTKRHVLSVGTI